MYPITGWVLIEEKEKEEKEKKEEKEEKNDKKHTYKETSTSFVFPNSCQGPLVVN